MSLNEWKYACTTPWIMSILLGLISWDTQITVFIWFVWNEGARKHPGSSKQDKIPFWSHILGVENTKHITPLWISLNIPYINSIRYQSKIATPFISPSWLWICQRGAAARHLLDRYNSPDVDRVAAMMTKAGLGDQEILLFKGLGGEQKCGFTRKHRR